MLPFDLCCIPRGHASGQPISQHEDLESQTRSRVVGLISLMSIPLLMTMTSDLADPTDVTFIASHYGGTVEKSVHDLARRLGHEKALMAACTLPFLGVPFSSDTYRVL